MNFMHGLGFPQSFTPIQTASTMSSEDKKSSGRTKLSDDQITDSGEQTRNIGANEDKRRRNMFIRNPLSIKQKTIKVKDNDVYEFLSRHGITPLGKDETTWFYSDNDRTASLLKQYRKGGDIENE